MDMRGRTVVVTGATNGLGLASAVALGKAGAHLVLAGRDEGRGAAALATVREQAPGVVARTVALDLADLSSVRRCAEELRGELSSLDVLMNNAGVMMPPQRRETVDGFELQMGTNHLGHAALTLLLLPLLTATPGSRVVTVSSLAARGGTIDLDDLQAERSYSPSPRYGASKLANLLFTLELQRRLVVAQAPTIAVAAHPGISATGLVQTMELGRVFERLSSVLSQSAEVGARPQLHAATADGVRGGDYYGPRGIAEVRGRKVTRATMPPKALDTTTAARLWSLSEELTGVTSPV
ncbi:oxidoreductase [Aquipuribacter hungaricus]|uniref:Oxidoreductase n=1 Tax=Aquipuribacter hungaricus TaxID=545624 RepID=A0ABV7WFR9_9MICO